MADDIERGAGVTSAPRVVGVLSRASLYGGLATAAIGVLVLCGWAFDVAGLRQIHPALGGMKVNAAIAFLLAGTALALYHRGDPRRSVSRALSGGVSVIGALTLVEYMPGADLGIDELLFADLEDATDPGRMSPTTAGSFLALGLALVLTTGRPRIGHMLAEWLALGAGLISLLALLGNLYGVRALYAVGDYEEVAMNPAVTMFVCSGSILCARPTRGLMSVVSSDGPGGSLARRLLPAAILLPAIIGGLLIVGEHVGLFDVEHETALFAASSIVCFTALTWWTASATLRVDVARRAAQEAVRASEEDLATTLNSIGDAVIATDTRGHVTRMNPVAEQLTGWSFDEARARHLDDVFHIVSESTGGKVESPVSRVLRDGQVVGLANHSLLIPRAGEPRAIADSGAPIHDGGSLRGVVLVFRDVSEDRRALETLRQAEAQLRQSQKMEAVSRLAGGIAHDFNNLLTVIISYGYMLQRRAPPGDPRSEDIAELVRAANRAAELTRQLLAFSGRQVMQPTVVDLESVIHAMMNMLRRVIGEDVQLDILVEKPLDPVHVDPGQTEQVILNLVINARDAMPQGGRITITTTNFDVDEVFAAAHPPVRAGAYVRMSVRDTGVGMDEATVAHVFEPFFTTKEAGKGTGLGLPTALGIVEQSGGHILVESAPGRGTAFDVYLPRHNDRVDATRAPAVVPVASSGHETVLLVEDDDQVRALICSVLRTNGYVVLEAPTPGDALLIAEQYEHAIDLLLTDVVMPRMSGRQLAERLSQLRPTMRVLFMSGHTDDAILLYGVESSALAFIQKPLTPDRILAKLRELLD